MARKAKVDWDAVERDWRAGLLTHAEICRKYKIDDSYLRRRAREGKWTKDLKEAARDRALVTLAQHQEDRERARSNSQGDSAGTRSADEDVIDDAVKTQLGVILDSRKRISKATNLVDRLMSELDGQTENREVLEELIEIVYAGNDPSSAANRMALKRALSLGSRVVSMVNLANAIGKLTLLRRQAFGLEEKAVKDPVLLDAEKASATDGRTDHERAAAVLNMIERAARAAAARKATAPGTETKQ